MKYCQNCGSELAPNANFCTRCGHKVIEDLNEETNNENNENDEALEEEIEDSISVGFCLLSGLIPILGVILYFQFKDSSPLKAKACLITSIASAAIFLMANLYTIRA